MMKKSRKDNIVSANEIERKFQRREESVHSHGMNSQASLDHFRLLSWRKLTTADMITNTPVRESKRITACFFVCPVSKETVNFSGDRYK
jgi:hypothetical protein